MPDRTGRLLNAIKDFVRAEIHAQSDSEPDSLGSWHEEEELRKAIEDIIGHENSRMTEEQEAALAAEELS